jgi:hypothetical protein
MPSPVAAPAWAAAVLLCTAGCTICPDPFDYSGPVPNGSAPQNDFRARANGLANPGSHPVPWPPVVRAAPRSGDESREITVVAEAVREAPADDTGPEAPVHAMPDVVMPAAAETAGGADPVAADHEPSTPVAEEPVPEENLIEEILPPTTVRPEILPRLRETPGWRPRG